MNGDGLLRLTRSRDSVSQQQEGKEKEAHVEPAGLKKKRGIPPKRQQENQTQIDDQHCGLGGSLEQSKEASERRVETVSSVSGQNKFPFVRSSSLWQTIESMEAFCMLPQKPHFRPLLEGMKESAREVVAIGIMAKCWIIVDKTRGLKSDNETSVFEDCLETLVELESHGFELQVIRDRLTTLLSIKDKEEKLKEQWKVVEDKGRLQEKAMEAQIGEIDRLMRELEEKRKDLLLSKDTMDSKTAHSREAIQREITQVQSEFYGLVAAPYRTPFTEPSSSA